MNIVYTLQYGSYYNMYPWYTSDLKWAPREEYKTDSNAIIIIN